MNELVIKMFVNNCQKEKLEFLLSQVNLVKRNSFEIDISENKDFDAIKVKMFPDGFLFFPLFIAYYKDTAEFSDEDIYNSSIILKELWDNNIPAIASCDFESKLSYGGGFNNKEVPW